MYRNVYLALRFTSQVVIHGYAIVIPCRTHTGYTPHITGLIPTVFVLLIFLLLRAVLYRKDVRVATIPHVLQSVLGSCPLFVLVISTYKKQQATHTSIHVVW